MTYSIAALLAATSYGAADFFGGIAARHRSILGVTLVVNIAAAVGLTALALVIEDVYPDHRDMWLGCFAGVVMAFAAMMLYRALAIGPMTIVAPVTAVTAIALPVTFGAVAGEQVSNVSYFGIALAATAVVLVAQSKDSSSAGSNVSSKAIWMALGAGLGIGIFYIAIDQTTGIGGLWVLSIARISAVALLVMLIPILDGVAGLKKIGAIDRGLLLAIATGIADGIANAFFLFAVHKGPIAQVTTLSSLYPSVTVALAILVFRESPRSQQWFGIALTFIAIPLIIDS